MKLKNNQIAVSREDKRAMRRRYNFPYMMLAPFAVFTVLFVVIPVIIMIVMSFTNMDIKLKWDFVGFQNYTKVFGYPDMGKIIIRTFLFVMFDTVFNVLGSIFVCIITTYYLDVVYQRKNAGLFFRILWLIPSLTPQIVYVFVWRTCFASIDGGGLINSLLVAMNLPPVDWFTNHSFGLLVFITCLKSASGSIILFSSAIHQIPNSIYQSARVDGASNLYICRRIVLPYLAWPITQKTLWSILGGFAGYETIRLFTNGGPKGSTTNYAYYIFFTAYSSKRYGYGAALSVFLVGVSIIMGMIMLKVFKVDKQLRSARMDI